jgi:hypothetical protein
MRCELIGSYDIFLQGSSVNGISRFTIEHIDGNTTVDFYRVVSTVLVEIEPASKSANSRAAGLV